MNTPSFLCPGTFPSTAHMMPSSFPSIPLCSPGPPLLSFHLGPQHPHSKLRIPTVTLSLGPLNLFLLCPVPVRNASVHPMARPKTTVWFIGHIHKITFPVSEVSLLPLAPCPSLLLDPGSGLLLVLTRTPPVPTIIPARSYL